MAILRIRQFVGIQAVVCLLLILVVSAPSGAFGQAEVALLITIPPMVFIQASPTEILFTAGEIINGERDDGSFVVERNGAIVLTMTGNIPHMMLISTDTEWFSGVSGQIPVNRLEWRVEGRDWTPLATDMQVVLDNTSPGHETVAVDLRLRLQVTDPPGTYVGEILFTLQGPDE